MALAVIGKEEGYFPTEEILEELYGDNILKMDPETEEIRRKQQKWSEESFIDVCQCEKELEALFPVRVED
jgi:Mg2+/Co2+ transporter CorB